MTLHEELSTALHFASPEDRSAALQALIPIIERHSRNFAAYQLNAAAFAESAESPGVAARLRARAAALRN